MNRIVLDTNVVVSGLMRDTGPPAAMVNLFFDQQKVLVVDDRIVAEYREVLTRPKLALDQLAVTRFLKLLAEVGEVHSGVAVDLPFAMPDATDRPFAEVALQARVDALVTGNLRHFQAMREHGGVAVLTPAEAVQRFGQGLL